MVLQELNRICASSQQVDSADNHEIMARNYTPVPNTTPPTFENHFGDTVSLFSITDDVNTQTSPNVASYDNRGGSAGRRNSEPIRLTA